MTPYVFKCSNVVDNGESRCGGEYFTVAYKIDSPAGALAWMHGPFYSCTYCRAVYEINKDTKVLELQR